MAHTPIGGSRVQARSAPLLGILLAAALAAPAWADEVDVDLELVLAVDVSGSMDRDEQILQRAGYMDAIQHPDVIDAIRTGLNGRIAVSYLEWAGPSAHRVAVPWMVIEDAETAGVFARTLAAGPIGTMRGTSISGGLATAAQMFEGNGYQGLRRVIDVSGDGPNNMGPPVIPTRDQVLALGIVINGLPITLKRGNSGFGSIPDLDEYYEACVIGGPGSFTVPVNDPTQLVDAIRRKLILEIADLGDGLDYVAGEPQRPADYDCLIGEKQRARWLDP